MSAIMRRGAASVKRASILKYVFFELMSRLWGGIRGLGLFILHVFMFLLFVLFAFPVGIVIWLIGLVVFPSTSNSHPFSMPIAWTYWAGCVAAAIVWFLYVYFEDKPNNPEGQSFWADVRRRQKQVSILTYPEDWDDLRRDVYYRDQYRCGNCGASNVELHAHHIVPLRVGGTNNITKLVTLCRDCHTLIHPHMRSGD